jgi:hypothetical protein
MFGGRFWGRRFFGARYWGDGGGETPPEPAQARGGASYLTREEMAELARAQRALDKKRRQRDREIDESVRELYTDIKHPEIKAARISAEQEAEDEETLITMVLQLVMEDA